LVKLLGAHQAFFVLTEVILHCDHHQTALLVELPRPNQGRRRPTVTFDPSRDSFAVHQPEKKICRSRWGPLTDLARA
jgi:hypothetical protein